ncbi:MAG TPA: DUF1080 domain-containing protein [Armatimonadota bacterium]|nr:DUF1080 domain-containing protein [Armatimonadota bacterium]
MIPTPSTVRAHLTSIFFALFLLSSLLLIPPAHARGGYVNLFDGHSLNGWHTASGAPYTAQNGILTCPVNGGNLYTDKEYGDFDFQFDFRLQKGGNNGIGIRAPFQGDAAYAGMEIQILDDSDPQYATLQPWQFHSSIYGVVPARRGSLKPVGQWNHEEIRCVGRHVKITVNHHVTVDADLDDVKDPAVLQQHPGIQRVTGHIGFLGHDSVVDFRNIRVKDLTRPLSDNVPPASFTPLFDGHDLNGWKGLVSDPPHRALMSPAELATAEQAATTEALKHWSVVDGVITYDGKNNNLCTVKDYRDFAMMVDWKIPPGGDSGIYLRGSPQVQIWDNPIGSGGLYNNQINPSHPLVVADRPIGQWNHFEIVMVGNKVTVYLNGQLVVDRVTMENYWERDKPIYPVGQIELQHHGSDLYFKNIFIRELPVVADHR